MSCRRCGFQVARRMFSICQAHRATVTTVQSSSDVPVVYVSRMKNVLEANRVGVQDGYTCLGVASCPVGCPDQPKGKFFINKFTGEFYTLLIFVNKADVYFFCRSVRVPRVWQDRPVAVAREATFG